MDSLVLSDGNCASTGDVIVVLVSTMGNEVGAVTEIMGIWSEVSFKCCGVGRYSKVPWFIERADRCRMATQTERQEYFKRKNSAHIDGAKVCCLTD